MLFTDGRPPIGLSKRNPYKAYAEFTTTEPIEIFDIEELQKLLHGISDEIDVMLVFKPGTNKFPQYQIWIAAPLPMMNELQHKCVEARNAAAYNSIFRYACECQLIGSSTPEPITNKAAYDELTEKIGIVDSVLDPYIFTATSEATKKILGVIFTTKHDICGIDHYGTCKNELGFGLARKDSKEDQIYFKLLGEDEWEVQINSSVAYCHFIKVVEIALNVGIVAICVKSHTASDDSYSKCVALQQYISECIQKNNSRRDLVTTTTLINIQRRKVNELRIHNITAHHITDVTDENTRTDKIKAFISHIVERYGDDNIKVVLDHSPVSLIKYRIRIDHAWKNDCYAIFIPTASYDAWMISICSPEMVALFSTAVGKSISELFPQHYSQDTQKTACAAPQKEMIPRTITDFNGDMLDFIAANCDVDMVTYRHANAIRVQMLIEKITDMIKDGSPICERTERLYGSYGSVSTSENISRIYAIGKSKPEAEMKIIGPAYLDLNQNQTCDITINPRNCFFSDIARQFLGEPDKE